MEKLAAAHGNCTHDMRNVSNVNEKKQVYGNTNAQPSTLPRFL